MDQQLIEKVMKQVSDELGIKQEECRAEATKEECCGSNIGLTEFVGTAIGDTIGLVIAMLLPNTFVTVLCVILCLLAGYNLFCCK